MWRNGRRAGFRFQCWETCGFKSRHPHQKSRIILIRLFLYKSQTWYIIECITRLRRDIHSYIISPFGLYIITEGAFLCDLMIYSPESEIYSFSDGWYAIPPELMIYKATALILVSFCAIMYPKRWYYVKELLAYVFRAACNRYWVDVPKY